MFQTHLKFMVDGVWDTKIVKLKKTVKESHKNVPLVDQYQGMSNVFECICNTILCLGFVSQDIQGFVKVGKDAKLRKSVCCSLTWMRSYVYPKIIVDHFLALKMIVKKVTIAVTQLESVSQMTFEM